MTSTTSTYFFLVLVKEITFSTSFSMHLCSPGMKTAFHITQEGLFLQLDQLIKMML